MQVARALVLLTFIGLGAIVAATQTVASLFNYQTALGAPLISRGAYKLHPPLRVFVWSARWHDRYPRVFGLAHHLVGRRCIDFGLRGFRAPVERRASLTWRRRLGPVH